MQIDISSNGVTIETAFLNQIKRRLQSTLSRISRWIQKVAVHLNDVNGPKGGVGKLCRVVVTAKGIRPVVVTESAVSLQKSASRAIRRAGVALKRSLKRQRDRKVRIRTRSQVDLDSPVIRNREIVMANTDALTASIISLRNRQQLGSVIDEARRRGSAAPELLLYLEEKLEWAECLMPNEIPDDVVTMNSKFSLRDLNTNALETCVLRYPDDAGVSSRDVSVLAPIGCAVLGCRIGDEIVVQSPSGCRRLWLVDVLY